MFITRYELNELLSHSQILIEEDTLISDKIRLLKIKNDLIIQEKSNKDEFIIRYSITKNDAEKFITERMSIYNKMWDGCGCKVDYYN